MTKDRNETMLLAMADMGLGKDALAAILEVAGDTHRDHLRFLRGPVVVQESPWRADIPPWMFKSVAGDRLRVIFQERQEDVIGRHIGPVELSAVMYPAMLEAPRPQDVADLYLWASMKAVAGRDDLPLAECWAKIGGHPVEDREVYESRGRCYMPYRDLAHAIRSKVLKHQMARERDEKREAKVEAPAEPFVFEALPLFESSGVAA